MKKLLFLLIVACSTELAIAQSQTPGTSHGDSLLSRWVIDINLLGGLASQDFTTSGSMAGYPNALNVNSGQLKYKNAYSFGGDAQLGFFWGRKRHFGIGTGILFMQQHGDAIIDNYHVEYQATDGAGNIFRQVVTGHDIRESITSSGFNIPVMLKYKNRFSKHWGFTADAGILINLQTKNTYTTHASFDYEAIYQFVQTNDGGTVSVYDNSPIPSVNDWMITKAEFLGNNPNGNLQDYFAAKRALGYNVGEGLRPGTRTGKTSYTQGSVGFILQPSFNYFLSDIVALNLGLYYMFQPFKNSPQNGYRLTDGTGTYSSVLNNATASTNQAYGINLGARFFLGRKRTPPVITAMYQRSPSQCGLCDGSISFDGLTPNQATTVDYSLNGIPATRYATTVDAAGKVNIPNLCAGTYTGIVARIKKENALGQTVVITDPVISISSQNIVHPTVSGCNGSITFNGLYAGKSATINYNMDDKTQASYTAIISADRSITIESLCAGKYTEIVATVGSCTAKGADFTLVAPTPPPPPPVQAPVAKKTDISTPILFDVNKTTVQASSLPVIEEAAEVLRENKNLNITIDGHADASGPEPANRVLSAGRANSVKHELTKRGINPRRVQTKGHGSSIPAATNSTYDGKQENRRAVIKVTSGK